MPIRQLCLSLFVVFAFTAVAQEADLAVEKLGPSMAAEGSDVSYSLTVTNSGPDAASVVTLSDPVPAGMSFVSTTQDSGPTFSCDATVTCTIASLAAGETATFTFVFHLDQPGDFTNVATVSSQTPDPNSENDTSAASTTTGNGGADLFVAKSSPTAGVAPDSDVTFVITLGNAGPGAATNVLLTDNLPAPLTFVSFTQTSGTSLSCGTSTCTIASFPAGETATFELVGHVPAGTPSGTEITNTVTVESDNDPQEENNIATTTVTVATADVRIVKSGPSTATAGTTVTYTITVTNDGPDAAIDVQVDDPQICSIVNCSLGTLDPAETATITANVPIPSNATAWSNTATVTTGSFDPDTNDNSSTVTTVITQSADLVVEKTGTASVVAGNDVTYTITVTNEGPSDASNVVLTDTPPAGTSMVSNTCGANPCVIGTLTANETFEVTIVMHVATETTANLSNTATVTSSTSDPDSTNNTSVFETAVTPAPVDVSIVKTGDTQATIGSDVTYTLTVANAGPGPALDVTVTDALPAGTTLVSASPACTGTTTITCTIGTLAANASTNLTLVVTMPSTPGPVSNTATVDTTSNDTNAVNDTSTFVTTVVLLPADLSITKSADRDFALVGSNVTYTIVVSNAGPGEATDVVVTDTLPAGTTLVSASPGCTGTTTVTCTLGTLAASASATLELVVQMPSTPGPVSNTASVDTSSTDPTPTNDAATNVVNAQAQAAGIPSLSPAGLAVLALSLASAVLVVLRRAS